MPSIRRKRIRQHWAPNHRTCLMFGFNFFGAIGWPKLPRDYSEDVLRDMEAAWSYFRSDILDGWDRPGKPWGQLVFDEGHTVKEALELRREAREGDDNGGSVYAFS